MSSYKYCVVPLCKSTTKTTPEKLFICMPQRQHENVRKMWCRAMKRDSKINKPLSNKTARYVCEDHFDLESDVSNYMAWKLMGSSVRLKKGVLPHIFECQREALGRRPKKPERKVYGHSCAVVGCTSSKGGSTPGVSFHKCPKDAALLSAWREACGRANTRHHTWVCSNHFSEDQIDRSTFPLTLLENAVPNVFTASYLKNKAAAAATAAEKPPPDTSVEPEIVIKEEPIDVDETDIHQPSTSRTEFILPNPSTPDTLTPSLGVAYSVADLKKENSTSPLSNGDKHSPTAIVRKSSVPNKKRKTDGDVADETVSTFDSVSSESNSVKDRPKDQFDAYGEYIAAKLRKLDWKSCAYVQKAIGDIMFEAEMGKFKEKSS